MDDTKAASCLGSEPVKSQFHEIECIDKHVDHLNRIVLVDPVCETFRKQRALSAIRALNKALHAILRSSRITLRSESQLAGFLHSQGHSLPIDGVERTSAIPLIATKILRP